MPHSVIEIRLANLPVYMFACYHDQLVILSANMITCLHVNMLAVRIKCLQSSRQVV